MARGPRPGVSRAVDLAAGTEAEGYGAFAVESAG